MKLILNCIFSLVLTVSLIQPSQLFFKEQFIAPQSIFEQEDELSLQIRKILKQAGQTEQETETRLNTDRRIIGETYGSLHPVLSVSKKDLERKTLLRVPHGHGSFFHIYRIPQMKGIVAKIAEYSEMTNKNQKLAIARALGDLAVPTKDIEDVTVIIEGKERKVDLLLQKEIVPLGTKIRSLLAGKKYTELETIIDAFFTMQKNMWTKGYVDMDPDILENYTYNEETKKVQIFDFTNIETTEHAGNESFLSNLKDNASFLKQLESYYLRNLPSQTEFMAAVPENYHLNISKKAFSKGYAISYQTDDTITSSIPQKQSEELMTALYEDIQAIGEQKGLSLSPREGNIFQTEESNLSEAITRLLRDNAEMRGYFLQHGIAPLPQNIQVKTVLGNALPTEKKGIGFSALEFKNGNAIVYVSEWVWQALSLEKRKSEGISALADYFLTKHLCFEAEKSTLYQAFELYLKKKGLQKTTTAFDAFLQTIFKKEREERLAIIRLLKNILLTQISSLERMIQDAILATYGKKMPYTFKQTYVEEHDLTNSYRIRVDVDVPEKPGFSFMRFRSKGTTFSHEILTERKQLNSLRAYENLQELPEDHAIFTFLPRIYGVIGLSQGYYLYEAACEHIKGKKISGLLASALEEKEKKELALKTYQFLKTFARETRYALPNLKLNHLVLTKEGNIRIAYLDILERIGVSESMTEKEFLKYCVSLLSDFVSGQEEVLSDILDAPEITIHNEALKTPAEKETRWTRFSVDNESLTLKPIIKNETHSKTTLIQALGERIVKLAAKYHLERDIGWDRHSLMFTFFLDFYLDSAGNKPVFAKTEVSPEGDKFHSIVINDYYLTQFATDSDMLNTLAFLFIFERLCSFRNLDDDQAAKRMAPLVLDEKNLRKSLQKIADNPAHYGIELKPWLDWLETNFPTEPVAQNLKGLSTQTLTKFKPILQKAIKNYADLKKIIKDYNLDLNDENVRQFILETATRLDLNVNLTALIKEQLQINTLMKSAA